MTTLAEAAGSGSDELHPDTSEAREVARITLAEFPPGELSFNYRLPVEGTRGALEWGISSYMGEDRARRILAAAVALITEAGDEASVDEIILGAAYRIAARRMASDRLLIEELGRG